MFQVCIQEHFDAAHFLRNYQGDCANLHGHRWMITVCVEGSRLDELGILLDFSEIKQSLRRILKPFDHCLLNDLPSFAEINPTAENLAKMIFQGLKGELPPAGSRLAWVRVNESPEAWVVYGEQGES